MIALAIDEAIDRNMKIGVADAVLGTPMGFPKDGIFGLLDLVGIGIIPLVTDGHVDRFHVRLNDFFESWGNFLPTDEEHFFKLVACPMVKAWRKLKEGDTEAALYELQQMPYCDWQVAAMDWVKRREEKRVNNAT